MSHVNLERCDRDTADAEICGSKLQMERTLQRESKLFAYPFGKNTPEVRELVARAGFTGAVTARSGIIAAGSDPFALSRIDIHDSDAPNLASFACRALHLMQVY